jgi:hypothetical protein
MRCAFRRLIGARTALLGAVMFALLPIPSYAYDDEDFHPCFTSGATDEYSEFYVGEGPYRYIEWINSGPPHYNIGAIPTDRYCSTPGGCFTFENPGPLFGTGTPYRLGAEILGMGDVYFTFYACS